MKFLLINQTFHPDVVSTAQHLTDLAVALAERGHAVTVVAGRRAYDNPAVRFPARERWRGVDVVRVAASGFGKKRKWRRAVDFATFMASCAGRLLRLADCDVVVALTSPPLISVLAALFVRLKGGRLVLWVMDLNPEEAVAAGWLRQEALLTRLLARLRLWSFGRADRVVALDRFMKARIVAAGLPPEKVAVIPPWAHDDVVRYDPAGREAFRKEHGLEGKFVVMYSGNHSPCHPLDTLLEAARQFAADARVVFCFVGGGSEFEKVRTFAREENLPNIICLPYQPLNRLSASLSAADLHVVVMGDGFAGIVHPCKIYNVLAIGCPVLYVGPEDSHIADLMSESAGQGRMRAVRHGDTEAVITRIRDAAAGGSTGAGRAPEGPGRFSKRLLLPDLLDVLGAGDAGAANGGRGLKAASC